MLGTEARGASNAKAKRELGWILRFSSWRQGFAEVYAKTTVAPGMGVVEASALGSRGG
jgi:hypothetical protein